MSIQRPRPPSQPGIKFVEHASELHGLHPHEFLIAVMRRRYIEISGQKFEPTSAQRLKAAEHLAAALGGSDIGADDDSYPPEEKKGKP